MLLPPQEIDPLKEFDGNEPIFQKSVLTTSFFWEEQSENRGFHTGALLKNNHVYSYGYRYTLLEFNNAKALQPLEETNKLRTKF